MAKQAEANNAGIDQTQLHIAVEQLAEAEHALTLSIVKDIKALESAEANVTAKVLWQVFRHATVYPKDVASTLFPLTSDNQLKRFDDSDWRTVLYLMFRMTASADSKAALLPEFVSDDPTVSDGEANVYIKRIKDAISAHRMLIARIMHHDGWRAELAWSKGTIELPYKLFGNVVRIDDLVKSLSDKEVSDARKKQNQSQLEALYYLTARTNTDKGTYSWARADEWADAWYKVRFPTTRQPEETKIPKLTDAGKEVRTAIEAMSAQGMEFDKQSPTAKTDNVQTFITLGKFLGVFAIDDTGKASVNTDKLSTIVAAYNESATKAAKAESKTDAQRLADAKANLWKFDTSDASLSKQLAYMVKTFKLDDAQSEALRVQAMTERHERDLVQSLDDGTLSAKDFKESFDGDAKDIELRRGQYLFLDKRDVQAELRNGAHKPGSDMFKGALKALSFTTMTRAQIDELAKVATDAYNARTNSTKAA